MIRDISHSIKIPLSQRVNIMLLGYIFRSCAIELQRMDQESILDMCCTLFWSTSNDRTLTNWLTFTLYVHNVLRLERPSSELPHCQQREGRCNFLHAANPLDLITPSTHSSKGTACPVYCCYSQKNDVDKSKWRIKEATDTIPQF